MVSMPGFLTSESEEPFCGDCSVHRTRIIHIFTNTQNNINAQVQK